MAWGGAAIQAADNAITQGVNLMLVRENRDWMERMSNTAHQREQADLRKAGLNPLLSVTQGHGAGTPMPQPAQLKAGMGSAIQTALAIKMQKAQIAKLRQDTKLSSETTRRTGAEATAKEVSMPANIMKEEILTDIFGGASSAYQQGKGKVIRYWDRVKEAKKGNQYRYPYGHKYVGEYYKFGR